MQSRSSDGPDRPFEPREKYITYCKYSYFLMHERWPEMRKTTYRAGTAAPFSGILLRRSCRGSITSLRLQSLPSQDHPRHAGARSNPAALGNEVAIGVPWVKCYLCQHRYELAGVTSRCTIMSLAIIAAGRILRSAGRNVSCGIIESN